MFFLLHFTIDKQNKMWYNWRPALDCHPRARAALPVKEYFAQILNQLFVQNFNRNFPKMLDFCIEMWYIIIKEREYKKERNTK